MKVKILRKGEKKAWRTGSAACCSAMGAFGPFLSSPEKKTKK